MIGRTASQQSPTPDRIVVLENGRITEIGSHDSLMATDGRYREMVLLKTRPVEVV